MSLNFRNIVHQVILKTLNLTDPVGELLRQHRLKALQLIHGLVLEIDQVSI